MHVLGIRHMVTLVEFGPMKPCANGRHRVFSITNTYRTMLPGSGNTMLTNILANITNPQGLTPRIS